MKRRWGWWGVGGLVVLILAAVLLSRPEPGAADGFAFLRGRVPVERSKTEMGEFGDSAGYLGEGPESYRVSEAFKLKETFQQVVAGMEADVLRKGVLHTSQTATWREWTFPDQLTVEVVGVTPESNGGPLGEGRYVYVGVSKMGRETWKGVTRRWFRHLYRSLFPAPAPNVRMVPSVAWASGKHHIPAPVK